MSVSKKTWYAIYVKSRTEKKVALELMYENIDHYLPLIKLLKQWSDRKKWVEEPLFRSYVFVNIEQKDYFKVLQINGAVKYISFEGSAVPIPEVQINAIKYYLEESSPDNIDRIKWDLGQKVEVISGSMTGLVGELIEIRGKHKVRVEIETVGSSLLIQIPKSKLRLI
ncbi:MAG: UpxY family transcription antiterminator [Bacteroidetes bacterium]|nr:UpxY family transcription antiterminator [Bacteroidota bacterium]MBL6942833.1 UpxY family transcription antiterminator [Bacteroidales bacterium]